MEFDRKKWKVYDLKSPTMIHWMINPGLVINELVLGQRVAKVNLVDKTSRKPRSARSYVPCPHCEKLNDSRSWSTVNGTAFKNWFGLYCPNCGKIIPCVWNITSLIVLGITSPIWFWFVKSWKKKWLKMQAKRFEHLDLESVPNPFEGKGWIKEGIAWGFFMYLVMTFIFPLIIDESISWEKSLLSIPIWLIGGLAYGYFMKLYMGSKGKEVANEQ